MPLVLRTAPRPLESAHDPRASGRVPTRRGAFEEALAAQYAEGVPYDETITWAKARGAAQAPSNWVLVLQAVPGCLPWGVLQTYLNDYLSQARGRAR